MILLLTHLLPAAILKGVHRPPGAWPLFCGWAQGAAAARCRGRILPQSEGLPSPSRHPPATDPNLSPRPAPAPPAVRAWHHAGKWGKRGDWRHLGEGVWEIWGWAVAGAVLTYPTL